MELINRTFGKYESFLFILCLAGLVLVYLKDLGTVPVHGTEDECRRALVALEMVISRDYLTPTINGEVYLNKPPLFNWIVAGSYNLFGNYSSFALRFPVVLSIFAHGWLIFYFAKKYTTPAIAAVTALAFMTNGRTVTLDSMLGLLDPTLALLIYLGFMLIFILGNRKSFLLLFITTYFITALGFLVKGLPALAHHGVALLVYFIYTRQFRLLFSWKHLAGILFFFITVAAYYIPYFNSNNYDPRILFSTLLDQSSKRYDFGGGIDFFRMLLRFPLEIIYHFLPWTLLVIMLVRKSATQIAKENKFVWFNALLFMANIPVYWIATLKNPHYLYPLLPLLFTLLIYVYNKTKTGDWSKKSIDTILGAGITVASVFCLFLPFLSITKDSQGIWIKSLMLFLSFSAILFLFIKKKQFRLFLFVAGIILVRMAFNWFVIPQRIEFHFTYQQHANRVNEIVKNDPLFIMCEYPAGFYDGITFFITKQRKEILRINYKVDYNAYYLVDDKYLEKYPGQVFLSFPYEYADNHLRYKKDMFLVKFRR